MTKQSPGNCTNLPYVIMKIFLLACLLCAIPSTEGVSIPEIYTSGTFRQIGYDIGKTFSSVIQQFYNQSKTLATVTQFIETNEGKNYYDGYLVVVKNRFQQYIDELTGLAEGAGVTFKQAFSLMIGPEVKAILKLKGVDACSDILLNDDQVAIGHNEDNDPLIKDMGYLVHAIVTTINGDVIQNFTAYTYPGSLSGNAFGFNSYGQVYTLNALFPEIVEGNKLPRYFMNRAFLGYRQQEHLEGLLNEVGVAYGFSLNYADLNSPVGLLTNYEVAPLKGTSTNLVTKVTIKRKTSTINAEKVGHYYHFNTYDHTNISQIPDVSSLHRKTRANALPIPHDVLGVKYILGDTIDKNYPIYRHPTTTDNAATVATAIFILDSCILNIYKTNPRFTPFPLMTVRLPAGLMCGG